MTPAPPPEQSTPDQAHAWQTWLLPLLTPIPKMVLVSGDQVVRLFACRSRSSKMRNWLWISCTRLSEACEVVASQLNRSLCVLHPQDRRRAVSVTSVEPRVSASCIDSPAGSVKSLHSSVAIKQFNLTILVRLVLVSIHPP